MMESSGTALARFEQLKEAYRCVQTASCPRQLAANLADVIFSGMEGTDGCHGNSVELTCISLTLVEKLTSGLTSQNPEFTSYCAEVLRVFQVMNLMSRLLHHFTSEDQFVSHLAAKSVSACVLHDLNKYGLVSPAWLQTCVQVFQSSPFSHELDSCLWSLTVVVKRLVKEAGQETVGKLLLAFDSSLTTLYSRILPEEADVVPHRRCGTTLCLLLDLLEVLTASTSACGASVCVKSPRLTHIHSSSLLVVVSCSSERFVRRQVLLLLKRAVLQTVGEDWSSGGAPPTGLKQEQLGCDMSRLAHSVLQAVSAGWLQSLHVACASSFGGNRAIRGGRKADSVMLRAISLLLLKSIELHIQTTPSLLTAAEVHGYLRTLWDFLRQSGGQLSEITHSCSFFTLLFGEQDDDMMEAAKALISIFLYLRVSTQADAACASGCNPHCHFLLLLQSVSFDHSILLDFLISMETCFLEYFVRYLKYLNADWQGFTAACQNISVSAVDATAGSELMGIRSVAVLPPVDGLCPPPGLRLVDYDTSDESDPDDMEVCQLPEGPDESARNQREKMKQQLFPLQEYRLPDSSELLNEPNSSQERTPTGLAAGQTLARAVNCLSELRDVVTRLQRKKLFPYNPASLLKLLVQVLHQ